jgi:hypothetical protein
MFDSIQANEGLLAPTNDFCAQPDPAAELQNICSGITHMSTIVHTAGISSSIQNQNDSSELFAHGVELWFSKTLLRKMVDPRYERASRYLGLLPVLAFSF